MGLGADKKPTATATSNREPHNVALQSVLTSSDCPVALTGQKGGIDAMKLVGIPYFGCVDITDV